MQTIRDIRIRIKSIQNTKKITESMRMIATRKVQRMRARREGNRPFFENAVASLNHVVNDIMAGSELRSHPYLAGRDVKKTLIILITGDRGLCGGYNANALREAFSLANEVGQTPESVQIVAIGTKGRDYFRRRNREVVHTLRGVSENPLYDDAQEMSEMALKMYNAGEVDQVYLVYTEYFSMLTQTPRAKKLLPLEPTESEGQPFVKYDDPVESYFEYTVKSYLAAFILGAMLESALCMQCARITGMDSASKNSEKIIDNLTLHYNQMRQGAITQEIAEIVGGANAIAQKAK